MNTVLGLLLTECLGTEVRLCQSKLKEKEKLFTCECTRIASHEWQIDLGMLNAYAVSCYPVAENVIANTEVTENKTKVQKRKKEIKCYLEDLKDTTT